MCRFLINPHKIRIQESKPDFDPLSVKNIVSLHKSIPDYLKTPLVQLKNLSKKLTLKNILVKDESSRFDLKAFKVLGSTYAIYRHIKEYLEAKGNICPPPEQFYNTPDVIAPRTFTFCTATDGNHGRGVARVAKMLRQSAIIYMPENSVPARVRNIEAEGTKVIVVDGNYDHAVEQCKNDAHFNGWQIISDTSWPGYEKIPRWIMDGYLTMFYEIDEEFYNNPDVIIVPAGVGALAASAALYYRYIKKDEKIKLVSVEPDSAACLLESIKKGQPIVSQDSQNSIMAGLNCGTPSTLAWPIIRDAYDMFISIPDEYCVRAMQTYYHSSENDPCIVSGESGSAGLGALLALSFENALATGRQYLGLNSDLNVMLLNTEGDTDPDNFKKVVNQEAGHTGAGPGGSP